MMSRAEDLVEELTMKQEEVAKLGVKLACSMWIEVTFPEAVWPVFTAVVKSGEDRKFYLQLRDAANTTMRIDFKEVPIDMLKQQHIQKLYHSNKAFRAYVGG